jgi:choice-of-anchor B domain-containing protein
MLGRALRLTLLIALLAGVAASPASAGHPPTQHQTQRVSLSEQMGGAALKERFRAAASSSFDCVDGMAGPYPCENVDLLGSVPLPALGGVNGNDIWGWTDPETGREYAIMGTGHGTGFVDVTEPANPKLVGILPTAGIPDNVLWRDIKVDGNYAFIVAEVTDAGMQVFDLTRLRDAQDLPELFDADAHYTEMSNTHNISINTETDYAYAIGTNTCGVNDENGGLHIIDISDPLNPTFAGCGLLETFANDGEEPNNYVHDVECVVYDGPDTDYQGREICFGSNENVVAIYDVTDKSNVEVISDTGYPTAAYTHQGSLTPNKRWFLFGDELDEQQNGMPTTTYIMDVSDLDAPPVPVPFSHPTASIDHNLYTHGKYVYESNYMAGLRILEQNDELLGDGQLAQAGYFDVMPGADIAEFAGTWSNYRFPGSGNVVISTIENAAHGLMVLKPRLGEEPTPPGPDPQPGPGAGGGTGGEGDQATAQKRPKKCKKKGARGKGKAKCKRKKGKRRS